VAVCHRWNWRQGWNLSLTIGYFERLASCEPGTFLLPSCQSRTECELHPQENFLLPNSLLLSLTLLLSKKEICFLGLLIGRLLRYLSTSCDNDDLRSASTATRLSGLCSSCLSKEYPSPLQICFC